MLRHGVRGVSVGGWCSADMQTSRAGHGVGPFAYRDDYPDGDGDGDSDTYVDVDSEGCAVVGEQYRGDCYWCGGGSLFSRVGSVVFDTLDSLVAEVDIWVRSALNGFRNGGRGELDVTG